MARAKSRKSPSKKQSKKRTNSKAAQKRRNSIARLKRLVKSGNAHSVKLSNAMAKKYAATEGHGVSIIFPPAGSKAKATAIVPKKLGYTRAQVSTGEPIFEGMVARVKPLKNGEIETIILPLNSTSIPKFIEGLRENPEWNKLKASSDRFTLRFNVEGNFYGLNHPQQFGTVEQLAQFMQGYKSAVAAANTKRSSQKQYLEMLEIVRVKRGFADLRNSEQKTRDEMRKQVRRYKKLRKQRRG